PRGGTHSSSSFYSSGRTCSRRDFRFKPGRCGLMPLPADLDLYTPVESVMLRGISDATFQVLKLRASQALEIRGDSCTPAGPWAGAHYTTRRVPPYSWVAHRNIESSESAQCSRFVFPEDLWSPIAN